MAIPNVSEGRANGAIAAIAAAFIDPIGPGPDERVRLLDVHSDSDHHRSVFTLAGHQGALCGALLQGALVTVERIDVMHERVNGDAGQHPHVGALDVVPVVYLDPSARGAACAEALLVADRLASELALPVFIYGELSAEELGHERTRAELRRGGIDGLARRLGAHRAGSASPSLDSLTAHIPTPLQPDFGPAQMHPTAGAALVCARPPLVAFNLQLAPPALLADAKRIAALVREGGAEGLPGVRAIGVLLEGRAAQLSMNVERPFEVSLAEVVACVSRHAALASAELVGLAPARALEGFPDDLPMPGFDPARHVIENALGSM